MKGHNRWLWAFITFIAYFFGLTVGCLILVGFFYRGNFTDQKALLAFFNEGYLRSLTVTMFGVGGFLAIRFAVDKLPVVTKNQDGDNGPV